jgi:hypothetical protein
MKSGVLNILKGLKLLTTMAPAAGVITGICCEAAEPNCASQPLLSKAFSACFAGIWLGPQTRKASFAAPSQISISWKSSGIAANVDSQFHRSHCSSAWIDDDFAFITLIKNISNRVTERIFGRTSSE